MRTPRRRRQASVAVSRRGHGTCRQRADTPTELLYRVEAAARFDKQAHSHPRKERAGIGVGNRGSRPSHRPVRRAWLLCKAHALGMEQVQPGLECRAGEDENPSVGEHPLRQAMPIVRRLGHVLAWAALSSWPERRPGLSQRQQRRCRAPSPIGDDPYELVEGLQGAVSRGPVEDLPGAPCVQDWRLDKQIQPIR